MLQNRPLRMDIPISNRDRAKTFYADKLGLTPVHEHEFGVVYQSASAYFALVVSESAGMGQYSLMTWLVDDIEAEVATLRERGVAFENYDFPMMKTENGIATLLGDRIAWFKDSEGNLLALAQLAKS